jgi:hypothetical protein
VSPACARFVFKRTEPIGPRCEHCEGAEGVEVDLGAHGSAILCVECEHAVLHGGPCSLGEDCPEAHS